MINARIKDRRRKAHGNEYLISLRRLKILLHTDLGRHFRLQNEITGYVAMFIDISDHLLQSGNGVRLPDVKVLIIQPCEEHGCCCNCVIWC
jgi:hypothetical protein